MFDKSNQIVFYLNSLLAIFGVLVALVTPYPMIGLFFVLSALVLIYDQFRRNKASFFIDNLNKTLTVHDAGGNKATVKQVQATKAFHADSKEYWFRNIRADGNISNIKVNDNDPVEKTTSNGSYEVCTKFPAGLTVANGCELILSYRCDGAYTRSEGVFSHVVNDATRQLNLIVELPKERPIASAKLCRQKDGIEEDLLPPIVTGQTRIAAEINNPIEGCEYCIKWKWGEPSFTQKLGRLFALR